jgi:hypothetical protein
MENKIEVTTVRGKCPDGVTCPAIHALDITPDKLYVQGWIVTDPEVLEAIGAPPGEAVVAVPRSMLPEV